LDPKPAPFTTVDEYIALFPPEVQQILSRIRAIIRETAPQATESISYKIPAYHLDGVLVYFAAYKNHVSIYPAPNGVEALQEEIAPYLSSKATLKFPLNRPIPYELIRKVVQFRVAEKRKN
jgi:uncharacterized protein YdhG (YjbR/CyaY superfamily)